MQLVLIDSSIAIEFLRTNQGVYTTLVAQADVGLIRPVLCDIVLFELWVGDSMRLSAEEKKVEFFCSRLEVLPLSSISAKQAGAWQRMNLIHGNDALIAAIAVVHRAKLATLNTKHFEKVPGLKLWRPN